MRKGVVLWWIIDFGIKKMLTVLIFSVCYISLAILLCWQVFELVVWLVDSSRVQSSSIWSVANTITDGRHCFSRVIHVFLTLPSDIQTDVVKSLYWTTEKSWDENFDKHSSTDGSQTKLEWKTREANRQQKNCPTVVLSVTPIFIITKGDSHFRTRAQWACHAGITNFLRRAY